MEKETTSLHQKLNSSREDSCVNRIGDRKNWRKRNGRQKEGGRNEKRRVLATEGRERERRIDPSSYAERSVSNSSGLCRFRRHQNETSVACRAEWISAGEKQ